MGGILSKWLVLTEHPVTSADWTEEGVVSDDALQRWVEEARSAYLDHCKVLNGRTDGALRLRDASPVRAAHLGSAEMVIVSATVTEVRPTSFTLAVRARPVGGDREMPVSITCTARLEDEETGEIVELGREIRDELIALEHSATNYN
jgi:acyl-CoA thioesterase FadM